MSPEPTQVVTGVISVEHQDTLPETALQEVDPAPPDLYPGLHLTCQNSPLPLRVRQQEGTVLALLVPCSYLELSMREQLAVVNWSWAEYTYAVFLTLDHKSPPLLRVSSISTPRRLCLVQNTSSCRRSWLERIFNIDVRIPAGMITTVATALVTEDHNLVKTQLSLLSP